MVTCPKCQHVRQPIDPGPEYECPKCGVVYAKVFGAQALQEQIRKARISEDWSNIPPEFVPRERVASLVAGMPATTTNTIPGREIDAVIDVVSAECAYGMNLLKDFFVGVSDVVGGRSATTQSILREARRKVMAELRAEVFSVGGNAIIGIDLDYSEFSGGGKSMLFVVATGTAVRLKAA
ncbi:MAG: heavy metal-binding domain-containing protein [Rhodocyclaceae bacterium]